MSEEQLSQLVAEIDRLAAEDPASESRAVRVAEIWRLVEAIDPALARRRMLYTRATPND